MSTAGHLMDLDFVFVEKNVIDNVITDGKKMAIAGNEFMASSIRHLIALKLHAIKNNPTGRQLKDLTDIVNLIRVNKINAEEEELKKMCLKYGMEKLYKTISENI